MSTWVPCVRLRINFTQIFVVTITPEDKSQSAKPCRPNSTPCFQKWGFTRAQPLPHPFVDMLSLTFFLPRWQN